MNLLVVEDDKETRNFLKSSLKAEGFVVDTAEDGKAGSYKASVNDYDLIVLDIELPYKNGRQICSELRASGKNMPIIMLSVKGEIDTKVDLLQTGADDYLTKPFSFTELSARIKALLRRPQKIEGEVLCIGDLVLDAGSRTVARAGKEVGLTPKEFFLLEYLMRNRGRVMSRQALLEHVWDVNADPFTNTVETHIVNLRKKLKQKNKREIICTVSGTGYKIN